METTQMSINRRVDEYTVSQACSGMLFSPEWTAATGHPQGCISQTMLDQKEVRGKMEYSISVYQVQVKLNEIFLMICTWVVKP